MGGSQSARRLTINNEDGVIQISTDLVERLTHGHKDTTATTEATSSNNPSSDGKEIKSSEVRSTQQTVFNPVETSKISPATSNVPHQQYPIQTYPEYTISAYKIQQEKEMELQAQDQYWKKRLYDLELTHKKINEIFQYEYNRAVDEINNAKGKKNINLDLVVPPCCADKAKVLQCYQENSREILKCSGIVDEFNNCVDQRRANIIATRC